jgi:hypothetical protein
MATAQNSSFAVFAEGGIIFPSALILFFRCIVHLFHIDYKIKDLFRRCFNFKAAKSHFSQTIILASQTIKTALSSSLLKSLVIRFNLVFEFFSKMTSPQNKNWLYSSGFR